MSGPQKKSVPENLVFETRVNSVCVSIWKNEDENGPEFHNVTIVRRYKSGDEWSNSNSYTGLGDLALLSEAVEVAKEWIRNKSVSG